MQCKRNDRSPTCALTPTSVGTSKSLYAPIFFKTKLEGRRLLSVRGRLFIFFEQAKCTDYVPIFPSLPAANTVVKPTLTLVADAAVTNFVFPGSSCRRGETENERGVHDEAGCGAK
jgi:hypothetical protein